MTRPTPNARIALLSLAALALAGACSETRTGRVDVALQVSPGVTLSSEFVFERGGA